MQRKIINVSIEKCHKDAIIPRYSNDGDSGMDVYTIEEIEIFPGSTKLAKIGLKFAIPEGYEIQVRPRSGLSLKTKLRINNSPGTIDSGYRDEVGVIISNVSKDIVDNYNTYDINNVKNNEEGIYVIPKGTKIAQLVLQEVPMMNLEVVDSVENIGRNREGGFGSTGL